MDGYAETGLTDTKMDRCMWGGGERLKDSRAQIPALRMQRQISSSEFTDRINGCMLGGHMECELVYI